MKKPSTWAHYKALLRKDLAQELHKAEMITSMGLYALLVLVVYGASLAQAGSELDIQQMAGGLCGSWYCSRVCWVEPLCFLMRKKTAAWRAFCSCPWTAP